MIFKIPGSTGAARHWAEFQAGNCVNDRCNAGIAAALDPQQPIDHRSSINTLKPFRRIFLSFSFFFPSPLSFFPDFLIQHVRKGQQSLDREFFIHDFNSLRFFFFVTSIGNKKKKKKIAEKRRNRSSLHRFHRFAKKEWRIVRRSIVVTKRRGGFER